MNEDKDQKSQSEDNKSNSYNQKNNIFISRKTKIPEKDSQHTKKKYIKFISIKKPYFQVENKLCTKNKKNMLDPNFYNGRWTEEESNRFIQGIALFGINWKKINTLIPTRTYIQIRSHAQKFFLRMKLCKDENLGIDFTLESVKNIQDMINHIKSKNPNYNVEFILKNLSHGEPNRRFFKKIKKINNNSYKNYNNIKKNEDKYNVIKLDENNNDISKNDALNLNLFENNIFNQVINNNCNNHFQLNYAMQSKNINNNDITFPKILNNSLNINSQNNLISNNFVNECNEDNNLLNDYLNKLKEVHIYFLSILNDLVLTNDKLLHINNSIDNVYEINKQDFNILNNNILQNNNNILYNINNPIINNNNSLINNNIPIINNNNFLITNYADQIDNTTPPIKNQLTNNKNKEIDKNDIVIEINNKKK